jgi:hypothetical protein
MPKLLRSSETAGCGATIELDNGEVVYVSIAQTGVLVRRWDMHGGLIKLLLSSVFGPKLYVEGNVYKIAQTTRALSLIYPEQASMLYFKNPVLAAFSNAIWHCASAAQVCTSLNEAAAKIQELENTSEAPSEMAVIQSDKKIVSDLAELMATGSVKPDKFYDVSLLPHPKEAILLAVEREILHEPSDARVEWLAAGAGFLASFQVSVGPKPLSWFGVELADLRHLTSDPKKMAKLLAENPDRARAERFLSLMKIESDQIQARVDVALRRRKARIAPSTRDPVNADAEADFKRGNGYVTERSSPGLCGSSRVLSKSCRERSRVGPDSTRADVRGRAGHSTGFFRRGSLVARCGGCGNRCGTMPTGRYAYQGAGRFQG